MLVLLEMKIEENLPCGPGEGENLRSDSGQPTRSEVSGDLRI